MKSVEETNKEINTALEALKNTHATLVAKRDALRAARQAAWNTHARLDDECRSVSQAISNIEAAINVLDNTPTLDGPQ